MGSGFSKKKTHKQTGNIIIRTDKSAYFPGDLVSGRIYLHIFTLHPPCQLEMKFHGIELIHQVRHENNKNIRRKQRKFNNSSWNLHQWEFGLFEGHIEIPFSFTLPLDLPPSFHQEGLHFLAHISYILQVWLKPLNKKAKFKPLSKYEKLVVRRPVKRLAIGYSEEKRAPLRSWFCIPRGVLNIKVHMERDIYSPGQVARVFLEIDNTRGKLDIYNAQVLLSQKLTLDRGARSSSTYYLLINETQTGRIKAGTKPEPQVLLLDIPRFRGDNHDLEARTSLRPKGTNDWSNGILGLTTQGKYISSEFYLEVICFMDGMETTTPKITRYIDIIYPDPQPEALNLPINWNPKVNANIPLQVNPSNKKSKKLKEKPSARKMIETEMIKDSIVNLTI